MTLLTSLPDEMNEQEQIRRARRGDTAAFGRLVERHQAVVFRIAYRLVRNRQEAEDIAQETFVKAYQALDRFDLERPLAPWLYRIARNTALNLLKRTRPEVSLIEEALPAGTIPGPEEQVLAAERTAETHALLRKAIADLQPNYRRAIELRHFEGLSYQQMSEELGVPLSDVKSWLFRARRRLRSVLEEED
jgi:RNA polymerase sigma-70 factor (ECF subfamily)